MRVVINESIQYKINEFAMGAVNSIEYIGWCHVISKIRMEPGSLVDERTLQLASSPYRYRARKEEIR